MPISSDSQIEPRVPDVCPDFRCPTSTADALKLTGFDVLNLANNHTMDWGLVGLQETISELHEVGLHTIGAGETLNEARRPTILVRNGLRVAFLGYGVPGPWNATETGPGIAPIDRELILQDIRAVRDQVELLIVSLHTGIFSDYPTPEDRRLSHDLIDFGCDLILGHGPHVLQGIEVRQNRVIAYSLGNFIIDLSSGNVQTQTALQEQRDSIILDVELARDGTSKVGFFPIVISEARQTVVARPEDAARISARMEKLSANLDSMRGLALWQHAGARTVEHEIRVLAFQTRKVGPLHVLKRLTKIRWRHLRLLLGYLVAKVEHASIRRPR
jgi:poly-gamma-glutamate synthesis protein (capsule biosynthesis protein)